MFTNHAPLDFQGLVNHLQFQSDFEPTLPLIESHIFRIRALLEEFVAQDPWVSSDLRQALFSMSSESVQRLLSSPYLAEMLLLAKEQKDEVADPLRRQIVQALVAELRVSGYMGHSEIQPNWTLGGDVVLNPEIAESFPVVRTSCGVHLNYQSDVHNTGREGIGGYDHAMA